MLCYIFENLQDLNILFPCNKHHKVTGTKTDFSRLFDINKEGIHYIFVILFVYANTVTRKKNICVPSAYLIISSLEKIYN